MTINTKNAVSAILATDPTVTQEQAAAALAALSGAGAEPLRPMVKTEDVQRLLCIKRTTLWSLAKAGVLVPVRSPGSKRARGYTRASVERYLRGEAS